MSATAEPIIMDRPAHEVLGEIITRLRVMRRHASAADQGMLKDIIDELAAVRVQVTVREPQLRSLAPGYLDPEQAGSRQRQALKRKNPEPGLRRCCICEEVKPFAEYNLKGKGKQLHAMCRLCQKEYHAQRYVKLGYKRVTVEVAEGDACVGHPCPICAQPFQPGQQVSGVEITHVACRVLQDAEGCAP